MSLIPPMQRICRASLSPKPVRHGGRRRWARASAAAKQHGAVRPSRSLQTADSSACLCASVLCNCHVSRLAYNHNPVRGPVHATPTSAALSPQALCTACRLRILKAPFAQGMERYAYLAADAKNTLMVRHLSITAGCTRTAPHSRSAPLWACLPPLTELGARPHVLAAVWSAPRLRR